MALRARFLRSVSGVVLSIPLLNGAPAQAQTTALPQIPITTPLARNPATGLPAIFDRTLNPGTNTMDGQQVFVACKEVNLIVRAPHPTDRPQPPYGTFPTEESYAGYFAFRNNVPIGICRRMPR